MGVSCLFSSLLPLVSLPTLILTSFFRSLPRLHPAHPARLLSWFLDSPAAPFGVHLIALAGKALGKDVRMWLGPSAAVGAMRTLAVAFPACGLGVSVATDSTLYQTEVYTVSHTPVACHRRMPRRRTPRTAPTQAPRRTTRTRRIASSTCAALSRR
ncbi:hypothetical protein C8J57DRAFT_72557 [Mycena rebaudengoi]|nr:hypothetical protein C8J57DRAFT_72557 [Mycena rebaudengoi]